MAPTGRLSQAEMTGMRHNDPSGDGPELVIKPAVATCRFVTHAEGIIELPQPIDDLARATLDRFSLDQMTRRGDDAEDCRVLMNVQSDYSLARVSNLRV